GDTTSHDERYARTDEFLAVFARMWDRAPFDHAGAAYSVAAGGLRLPAERPLRFGLRLHVIARERAEDAWAEARRMLEGMDPDAIAAAQARYARMDSV